MKLKIAGKILDLPAPAENSGQDWKFSSRPGGWLIAERMLANGSVERVRIMAAQAGNKISIHGKGLTYTGEWFKPSRASQSATGSGETGLTAQFPGKVRKILVAAGQTVKEGDNLLLVEAMKMEFTIKAPSDGKVRAVLVKEGEQLQPGKDLVDFEPAKAASK